MTPSNRLPLTGTLLCMVLALGAAGCGGGSSSTTLAASNSGTTSNSGPLAVSVSASSATVPPGSSTQITASVSNDSANAGVAWVLGCTPALPGQPAMPCGTISASTTPSGTPITYTAPSVGDLTVAITATSVSNGNVSAVANLTVPGIAVSVSPGSATVNIASSSQVTAMVADDAGNQGVTWTLSYTVNGSLVPCPSAAVCGSVSPASTASGLPTTYTAPSTPPVGSLEVALTATSVANTAASAQSFVTVPGINILIDPNSAS